MPAAAPRPSTPRQRMVLAVLLLLAAGLRLYNLGHRSLSTDEANVFWMARGTASEIILHNAAGNSAPPLYALALNPLAEAHASEAVLRSLSCAAGVAALAVLYVLAREYSGPVGGLFAVFVAAVAPSQVFYSQFLREYSLAFLCATLLLLAFTRFQRSASWRTWTALTVAGGLSLFVQYGLALLVVALNLVFVIELRQGERRTRRLALWALGPGRVARWRLGRLRPDAPPPAPPRRLRRILSRAGLLGRLVAVPAAAHDRQYLRALRLRPPGGAGPARIYLYHFAVTPFRYYYPEGRSEWIAGVQSPADPAAHHRQIDGILARPGRAWMLFSMCQGSECEVIRRAAAGRRTVRRIAADTGTELYLAEAAAAP